jgi:endoglucanase
LTDYTASNSQHWILAQTPNGEFTIMNKRSSYVLDVPANLNENNSKIITYSRNGGSNQNWILVKKGDEYLIKTPFGKCLDLDNGTKVVICDPDSTDKQLWKFCLII